MKSRTEPAVITHKLTYEDLVALGSINQMRQVIAAGQQVAVARKTKSDVEAAGAAARQVATSDADPRARRLAKRALEDHRETTQDAEDGLVGAQRAFHAAKVVAHDQVAPILVAMHLEVLAEFMPPLQELTTAAKRLSEVERVSREFDVEGAGNSPAPLRSALPAAIGDQLAAQLKVWATIVGRIRGAA